MKESNGAYRYEYSGPVMDADSGEVYAYGWKASTVASSDEKALSNLMYRFKKKYDLFKGTRLKFTGRLYKLRG